MLFIFIEDLCLIISRLLIYVVIYLFNVNECLPTHTCVHHVCTGTKEVVRLSVVSSHVDVESQTLVL